MDTLKNGRVTKPLGLRPQHGSGTYLLMVNNNPAFSSLTTRAICGRVLALLVGAILLPAGMLPAIAAPIATGLLLSACLIGWATAYLCDKSGFPLLAGGMRMTGTLIGVAGVGLLSAATLSLERAVVLATLLLSAIAGLNCMNMWKEVLLRAGQPTGRLRYLTAHVWHLAYGGVIFAIILSPFTIPAMFRDQTIFLVARFVPLVLGVAMALALIERSYAYAGMRHVSERVALLGLAAQLALLVSMNPFSLAWGIALLLVCGQIFTLGQWLLTYQLAKTYGMQSTTQDLVVQNQQLREDVVSQQQQFLQVLQTENAKTQAELHVTFAQQREQLRREVAQHCAEMHQELAAIKAQVGHYDAEQHGHDAAEMLVATLPNLMHDLIHPVAAIMGTSQMLMMRFSNRRDIPSARQAQTLFSYAQRLSHTLKFVLDFDKGMQPIMQPFDLVPLLTDLARDEQMIQTRRTITFLTIPPLGEVGKQLPDNVMVTWERDRIEAVLFNLIDNAEKYSQRDTPIVIRAWLTPDEASVVVSVRDFGVGMSAATQQHIFERRYRSGQQGQVDGYGLGLWMVKTIVAQHHGTIAVTSVEGEGTTMCLTIPRVMPDNQDESHQ